MSTSKQKNNRGRDVGFHENRFNELIACMYAGPALSKTQVDGYINLMSLKRRYLGDGKLRAIVDDAIASEIKRLSGGDSGKNGGGGAAAMRSSQFREELFDKLYSFFSAYLSPSGSVYYCHTPAVNRVFDRVYTGNRDVGLFWKTRGLYYVKSDTVVKDMPVSLYSDKDPAKVRVRFDFKVDELPEKIGNVRIGLSFSFAGKKRIKGKGNVVPVSVSRASGKREANTDRAAEKISREAKGAGYGSIAARDVQQAIGVFLRQTEVDFFIHQNAGGFLREQFRAFLLHYAIADDKTIFDSKRFNQLRLLEAVGEAIIACVAKFEDELRRVWEKPKFVRGLHFVVTLDKLAPKVRSAIAGHSGVDAQIKEWLELKLVKADFSAEKIKDIKKPLPVDTKHFKNLEIDIVACLGDDLDDALDGELIQSENWQALNSLRHKYAGRVKCIYIDPPFNLASSDQFDYRTNYKDSCWATMLQNRLTIANKFLADDGAIFVRCDYHGNWIVRCLLDNVFGNENFKNEIVVNRTQEFFKNPKPKQKKLMADVDSLLLFGKGDNTRINSLSIERKDEVWYQPFLPDNDKSETGESNENTKKTAKVSWRRIKGKKYYPPCGRKWGLTQEQVDELYRRKRIKFINDKIKYWPLRKNIKNNWTDIPGYSRCWGFKTENAEELLSRCMDTVTDQGKHIVADFFAGSGTTMAVAQKRGFKWLGIEMGEHFGNSYESTDGKRKIGILGRMKKVLAGHQSGISKESGYKGGGAFKYYALESYENVLSKAEYYSEEKKGADAFSLSYPFFFEPKLTNRVIKVDESTLDLCLTDLYGDIDLAETLSHASGCRVGRRKDGCVVLSSGRNGEQLVFSIPRSPELGSSDPIKISEKDKQEIIQRIRDYLWWGFDAAR